ncbi:MAG TPA: hypothetical protein VHI11_00335 [Jiangellaceae bacterium]|nr:hypothetical protein [Jiangellaceae bacterium]
MDIQAIEPNRSNTLDFTRFAAGGKPPAKHPGRKADGALLADLTVVVGHDVVGVGVDADHASDFNVDPGLLFDERRRTFTPEEFGSFLAACRPFYRDHFLTQIGTGLRSGELLGLRRRRVFPELRRIISTLGNSHNSVRILLCSRLDAIRPALRG